MKFYKVRKIKVYLFLLLFLFVSGEYLGNVISKKDSLLNKENILKASLISATTTSYVGLYNLWYKKYPQSSFHFFNDFNEWNQIDKIGHVYSSYHVARKSHLFLKKRKISESLFKASAYSFLYMVGIEVFDGFSKQWGFSNYDLISNLIGTTLYYGQEKKLKRQALKLKFSSHQTGFAKYRPSLLGENSLERIFKDYNGQTYWLNFDFNTRLQEKLKIFKFLNLSIGYSIDGFTGARNNPNLDCLDCNNLERQSQFILSFDIDLSEIEIKNKFLKLIVNSFSIIKLPAPAVLFQNNSQFKWLYF